MKIDIHLHYEETKKSDGGNRTLSKETFQKIVQDNDLDLVCLIKHNDYNDTIFRELKDSLEGECKVWPGIELDILTSKDNIKHCLVISDDEEPIIRLSDLIKKNNPLNINDLITNIKERSDIVVIPHFAKSDNKRNFNVNEIKNFKDNDIPYLLEVSESAIGPAANNEYKVIKGSDAQDNENYNSKPFDFTIPFDTISDLINIINSDEKYIKTHLKSINKININHIGQEEFKFEIRKGINFVIGNRGSGKTCILESAKDHLNNISKEIFTINSESDSEKNYEDLTKYEFDKPNISTFINDSSSFFQNIKNLKKIENKTGLPNDYYKHYEGIKDKKNRKKIKISEWFLSQKSNSSSTVINPQMRTHVNDSIVLMNESEILDITEKDIVNKFKSIFEKYDKNSNEEKNKNEYIENNTNNFITKIKTSLDQNSDTSPKPEKNYLKTIYNVCKSNNEIINDFFNTFTKQISPDQINTVTLNNKNLIWKQDYTNMLYINEKNEFIWKSKNIDKLNPFNKITDVKEMLTAMKKIINKKSTDIKQYNEEIEKIKEKFDTLNKNIISDYDFINFFFSINNGFWQSDDNRYFLSKGEKRLLLFDNMKKTNAEYIILDEPESGFSNREITLNLIPEIKRLKNIGKTFIIATHNANIAANLEAVTTIYCEYDNEKYKKFCGSSFLTNLISNDESKTTKNWTDTHIETLEGGEEYFEYRTRKYNSKKV